MALGPGSSALTPTMLAPPRMPASVATVRRQFDARALRFATADVLPREVARRMVERLQLIRLAPSRIADIGCALGGARAPLLVRYPQARWIGVDLAPRMLAAGRAQVAGGLAARLTRWLAGGPADWVAADAAALPLADGSIDLVFSNLMLHWHPQPHIVLPEWKRVLDVGGLLMFSCFGPDTLKELRAAMREADPHARPMTFVDMHDFGDMMVAAGLSTPVMDAETLTLTYVSARALIADVRALGGNPRDDRAPWIASGPRARALLAALERRRGGDGRIALTFEVAYGHAWKPEQRGPAQATISLDGLRSGLGRRAG